MSAYANTAKIVEELVEYDGPQLLLLKTNRNRHMLAAAVKQHNVMQEPFFGGEITDKTYDRYFDDKADLHFALDRAIGRNYYMFDFATAKDNTVKLQRVKPEDASNPLYWPDVGFFCAVIQLISIASIGCLLFKHTRLTANGQLMIFRTSIPKWQICMVCLAC